jgi:uncharacterized cupredoxin-like copper-binding protein
VTTSDTMFRPLLSSLLHRLSMIALLVSVAGCDREPGVQRSHPGKRALTITAVPLLTKELQSTYPFLVKDFATGGVLDGKEVYAFSPSSLTVLQGDTIDFSLINPEDDVHSFVLGTLSVALPPQSTVSARYIARDAGIFEFKCNIPAHLPMMYGQLVVLPTT